MTPETHDLFNAIASADAITVQRALEADADVNATDDAGRSIVSYAALGNAIDAIDTAIQPRLSECRLNILQLVTQHPELSLYSLNAPMPWAGGVTLLGLMSWLNMPSEIMCLLEFTQGLVEVDAMDAQGATPLMYATRDGNLQVVQHLLEYGARPDLKDISKRSAIQYALPHPQILWLCEEFLRRSRSREIEFGLTVSTRPKHLARTIPPPHQRINRIVDSLFFSPPAERLLIPPPLANFDGIELRRTFEKLLCAIRSEDLTSLRELLTFLPPENDGQPPEQHPRVSIPPRLVNLRDSTGLTLVHHVVSQRRCPSIAVLDALYGAGSDVGLFSALGFTPLHHLARTARDFFTAAEEEGESSVASSATNAHPLYVFTMHLVRDLHAPLGATDSKGETPLHAVAEHGHSFLVLQAMLDCDRKFSGKEAVREARNERGLRPVEVAKPEFLSLFLGGHRGQGNAILQPENPSTVVDAQHQAQRVLDFGPPCLVRPGSASVRLAKKPSSASLISRSSGSSSTSSGAQSYTTYWSHTSPPSRRSNQLRKPTTPIHALPTPDPTPPGSFTGSPSSPHVYESGGGSIDVPACVLDILYNLSFCASALHAYTQPHPNMYDTDMGSLPDLPALWDILLFTRDLAAHVLEHWSTRLESARNEFERAKRELRRAEGLRVRVARHAGTALDLAGPQWDHTKTNGKLNRVEGGGQQGLHNEHVKHAGVQTEATFPTPFIDSHRLVSSGLSAMETFGINEHVPHRPNAVESGRETVNHPVLISSIAEMDGEGTSGVVTREKHVASQASVDQRKVEGDKTREADDEQATNKRSVENPETSEDEHAMFISSFRRKVEGRSRKLELIRDLDDEACAIGRDVKTQRSMKFADTELSESPSLKDIDMTWLLNTPRVLRRADRDLQGVTAHFTLIQQSFIRAQQSIAHARTLLKQAIKSREDQLIVLIRVYHQKDFLAQSGRLPPILERSAGMGHGKVGFTPSNHDFAYSAPAFDPLYNASIGPVEEPHLRRLLTRKVAKYVDRVFDDLQKAHVWLRIVREVLRGVRRRAYIEQ